MLTDLDTFKLIVDRLPIHVIITDYDGIVQYANKAVTTITGYTQEEIIGKTPRLWGKQMPPEFYEHFWQMVKVQKQIYTGKIRNRRKSGECYDALIEVVPIIGGLGSEVLGFIGIEQDLSALRSVIDSPDNFA